MSEFLNVPVVGGPMDGNRLPSTGRETHVRYWPTLAPTDDAATRINSRIERYRAVFACNRSYDTTTHRPHDRCVHAYAHEGLSDGEVERIIRESYL